MSKNNQRWQSHLSRSQTFQGLLLTTAVLVTSSQALAVDQTTWSTGISVVNASYPCLSYTRAGYQNFCRQVPVSRGFSNIYVKSAEGRDEDLRSAVCSASGCSNQDKFQDDYVIGNLPGRAANAKLVTNQFSSGTVNYFTGVCYTGSVTPLIIGQTYTPSSTNPLRSFARLGVRPCTSSFAAGRSTLQLSNADHSPIAWLYQMQGDPAYKLEQVTQRLVKTCMADQGFEIQEALPQAADLHAMLAGRYTPPFEKNGSFGYVFSTEEAAGVQESIETKHLTPAYQKALWGNSSQAYRFYANTGEELGEIEVGNGCMAHALATIFGSVERYQEYASDMAQLSDIGAKSLMSLAETPEGLQAASTWSTCMKASGYDYATPFLVGNADFMSPRPQAAEQAVAKADALCRKTTDVESKLLAAEVKFSTGLVQKTPGLLERFVGHLATIVQAEQRIMHPTK